jgi:Methyltransferase domain
LGERHWWRSGVRVSPEPRESFEPFKSERKHVAATMKKFIYRNVQNILHRLRLQTFRRRQDSYDLTDVAFFKAAEESVAFLQERLLFARQFRDDLALIDFAISIAKPVGLFLEFGVASGRTIRHIASRTASRVYGFDSFEGLPEDWRSGFERGRFAQALPAVPPNVSLIKGWFSDTLPEFTTKHSDHVAFLHVDCDLYSSTACIFHCLASQIRAGTVIIFDEYFNYPGWRDHEHRAFQEFLNKSGLQAEYVGYVPSHQQLCVLLK